MSTRRRTSTTTTTRIEVSSDRGVFMISVAAELAKMHPQTLRMYEQRGLIEPKRSPKGTRLYSHEDVEKLRRIQQIAPVETLQPQYSLIERDIEAGILPFAEREGIGVIVYSPMGSGLLTGKMTRDRIQALPSDP